MAVAATTSGGPGQTAPQTSAVVDAESAEETSKHPPPTVDAASGEVSRIVQLDETVINRIAAGEVVVRPANAVKELLENSLDAKSSRIVVATKAGGLKLLKIEDDGHGIREEDMPILCERFTTSKLRKYEDLTSIGTFGFRGEALASISHVAHVTVMTMTAFDTCARIAQYSDGVMSGSPRPCAGTRGTTIVAEDFFYNNSTRRQALGKESIEQTKILEVVQKYAMHFPTVSFTCRKASTTRGAAAIAELHTEGGEGVTSLDAASVIYGQALAKELFSFQTSCEEPRFQCRGLATGPNWTTKGSMLTLFINNRLVECSPLRRAVEVVYAPVLPRHHHPWVYLAIDLDAATVDVNVHPTKNEVQFLHEELIGQRLQEALQAELQRQGGSRRFELQMPLLGSQAEAAQPPLPFGSSQARPPRAGGPPSGGEAPAPAGAPGAAAARGAAKPGAAARKSEPYLNPTRVRTDHKQMSLETLWRPSQAHPAAADGSTDLVLMDVEENEQRRSSFQEAQQLQSIWELKTAAKTETDAKLSKRLSESVYVGPVTHELVLLQCGASLCLVNLAAVARECGYQRLLDLFGAPGRISLKEPLPLLELLRLGILDPDSGYDPTEHAGVDVEQLARRFAGLLEAKAEMLHAYFMLEISDGEVRSLPNALGVTPDVSLKLEGLPLFLIKLCVETNWYEERPCLGGLCRLAAEFCAGMLLPSQEEAEAPRQSERVAMAAELNEAMQAGEHEDVAEAVAAAARRKRQRTSRGPDALEPLRWLHEAVRREGGSCQWPAEFGRDGTVLDLVSLDQLYRVFERC